MVRNYIILGLIIFLALLIRGYDFGTNPPALNSDEVAIGYNAYSILKTGKDEYAKPFPIAFRSFDDYKPPLYIYLTVPSVALLGLTQEAVRLPSLILGLGSILGIYFLAFEISKNKKVALLSALLLTLAPWHIVFSRTAYETAGMLFFLIFGSFFFLRASKKPWLYIVSAILFGLAPFMYQAGKILAPGLVAFLVLTQVWLADKKILPKFLITLLFAIALLPSVLTLVSKEGSARFQGLSILGDPTISSNLTLKKQADWLRDDNPSALLFHTTQEKQANLVAANYLSYFRPDFLFYRVDDHRTSYVPDSGLVFALTLPFFFIGFYFLWQKSEKKRALFLIFWLLLAPLPASVVMGSPNSTRTIAMLVPISIVTAYGLASIRFKKSFLNLLLAGVLGVLISWYLASYMHDMLVHAPLDNSQTWYFGRKEAVAYAERIHTQYKNVYVSNSLDEPYIFFLFYTMRDPKTYQTLDGGTVSGGFKEDRNKFANYHFQTIDWNRMQHEEDALFIGLPSDFPQDAPILTPIYYLNGKQALVFVSKKGPVL